MKALFAALLLCTTSLAPPRQLTIRLHGMHVLTLPAGCKRTQGDPKLPGGTLQCSDATEWQNITLTISNAYMINSSRLRVKWGVNTNKWEVAIDKMSVTWLPTFKWVDANTIDVQQ